MVLTGTMVRDGLVNIWFLTGRRNELVDDFVATKVVDIMHGSFCGFDWYIDKRYSGAYFVTDESDNKDVDLKFFWYQIERCFGF